MKFVVLIRTSPPQFLLQDFRHMLGWAMWRHAVMHGRGTLQFNAPEIFWARWGHSGTGHRKAVVGRSE